jgi:hypothetical protein|tara:strand:- start:339 stop:590 length:252 start_codon:yes stop_codon:yes gene_type:complete
MNIKIYNGKMELERTIETDKTLVDPPTADLESNEISAVTMIEFFHSCSPPHTGSVVSGSVVVSRDADGEIYQKYFEGETYSFE